MLYVADAQAGLITSAQLTEVGVSGRTTSRRELGGMWTRVLPGVHLVEGGEPTRHQRELAALLYAGAGSMLTGLVGTRRHGLRGALQDLESREGIANPSPVHVLVPHERRRLSTGYVRIERTRRMPSDGVRIDGVAVAPAARAVADASRRLRRPSDVLALVADAVQRGLVTVADLRVELTDGSRRGSRLLREALELVDRGVASAAEGDLVPVLALAGLDRAVLNARLVTSAGEYVAIADAWVDDIGLAVEVDSREFHATLDRFDRTVRRNARYAASGVLVVTVLPSDLRSRPNAVAAQLRSAAAAAAGRARPSVWMTAEIVGSAGEKAWRWGA